MELIKEFLKSIPHERATEEALEKVVDKKKVRNYLIIMQFDKEMKRGKMKTVDIYYTIAENFKISYNLVRLVISQRRANQI